MSGIVKGGADAWAEIMGLAKRGNIDKGVEAVEGVDGVVERFGPFAPVAALDRPPPLPLWSAPPRGPVAQW